MRSDRSSCRGLHRVAPGGHVSGSEQTSGTPDTVAFSVLLESGDVAPAEILLGRASQVMNVPEPREHEGIVDEYLVRSLEQKTSALGRSRRETESGDGVQQGHPDDSCSVADTRTSWPPGPGLGYRE
ncbi:hypothetical protein DEI81_14035 [Curtobacterium sp. MCBD17_013]|nr:hypothetical protein DEI81_14035 [Curtobacterium sp. MCBD17_013]